MEKRYEKSCGAVVYRKTDDYEFLIIRHNGGHYAFPKGHVEGLETEVETAYREIKEETGIDVNIDTGFRFVVTYSPKENVIKDVVYFVGEKISGFEKAQESEISEIVWLKYDDVLNMITYDNDKNVLEKVMDYLS